LFKDFLATDLPSAVSVTSKFVVITDTHVHKLYYPLLHQALLDAKVLQDKIFVYTIPIGEHSKSRAQKEAIEDWMLDHACNRDTCIIALGGGKRCVTV
jgi:3-dehydroquinate synthetase